MTHDTNDMSPDAARKALDAAHAAGEASIKRAQGPTWVSAIMALAVGALVVMGVADKTELMIFCFAVIFGLMAYQRKRSGIMPLEQPRTRFGRIALFVFIVIALGLYMAGIYLTDNLGYAWGPFAAGGTVAVIAFLLSLENRR